MWIVAIGWIYVVILMAATETSVVAGVMTFLIYCMIPLSILFYLTGSKRRHARRIAARQAGKPVAGQDDGTAAATGATAAAFTPAASCGTDAGADGGCGGD